MRLSLLSVLLGLAAVSTSVAADGKLESLEEQAFKQAAALADVSVVRIETVGGLEQLNDELLSNGPTSGVVVTSDGFIISSSFNFISNPASILVTLPDGRRLAAKQIANDRLRLLTLLKVEVEGLVPAKPVPRDQIKVGQWALAMGRTLDNSTPSISVGIVSAVNRIWGKAIQTDAKTSPINYGGALVDIEGRTLGVIAPLSPTGGGEMAGVEWYDGGIGFAIPLEDVYASLDRLKQGTDLLPGLMGITFAGGQSLNVPVVVDRVRYNSPAQQAGLKTNDMVVAADGEKIGRIAQLKHVMGRKYAGDQVKLVVTRDEKSLPVEISLVGQLVPYDVPFLGILPERTTSPPVIGVVARLVFAKSPAEQSGMQRGDRIIKYNNNNVKDLRVLGDLVGRGRPGEQATVTYVRNDREMTVEVKLGSLPEDVLAELPAELIVPSKKPEAGEKPADEVNPNVAPEKKKDGEIKTGRFTETLPGHDHDYWAYVPEEYTDSHAYGLVVWIHPPGDTMEATIFKQWKSICDRRGLILIAPKAEKAAGWQPGEAEFVKSLIGSIREKYAIDSSRIVLHSHGRGAGMNWLVSSSRRDLVRGVVLTGIPYVGQPSENEPELRQQYFLICGDADKLLPKVKASVAALRKLKLPVSFSTVKGLGPKYPPDETIDEIGRWVDSMDRI